MSSPHPRISPLDSTGTQLKYLNIDFNSDMLASYPPRRDDLSSLPTRFVLPVLIEFQYVGEITFLEDFASRIDAPIIEKIEVTIICGHRYDDTYDICGFFGRGEELRSSRGRTTHIQCFEDSVVFTHHFSRSPSSPGSFRLRLIARSRLDERVTRVCFGFQPWGALHKMTRLEIEGFPEGSSWRM